MYAAEGGREEGATVQAVPIVRQSCLRGSDAKPLALSRLGGNTEISRSARLCCPRRDEMNHQMSAAQYFDVIDLPVFVTLQDAPSLRNSERCNSNPHEHGLTARRLQELFPNAAITACLSGRSRFREGGA